MEGFRLDTSAFDKATKAMSEMVKKNTLHYAQAVAAEAQRSARAEARWVDRSGTARRNLTSAAEQSGTSTRIAIGGSAPNRAKHSEYDDYMEILEFGHESLSRNFPDLSIIYPTAEAVRKEIQEGFGDAALRGAFRPKLVRSRRAVRTRKRKFRERYYRNTGYKAKRSATFGGKLR